MRAGTLKDFTCQDIKTIHASQVKVPDPSAVERESRVQSRKILRSCKPMADTTYHDNPRYGIETKPSQPTHSLCSVHPVPFGLRFFIELSLGAARVVCYGAMATLSCDIRESSIGKDHVQHFLFPLLRHMIDKSKKNATLR